MVRKSKFTEFIDKFLSGDMSSAEKEEFRAELETNPDLQDELNLQQQVENAIGETDIMSLRNKLQQLDTPPQKREIPRTAKNYSFSLKEDLTNFKIMTQPVSVQDVRLFNEGLPILHLIQHHVAEKENVHQLYKELPEANIDNDFSLSSSDQLILDEIEKAMEEKDVIELRANLQEIAENIPAYPYTFSDIENYLNGDMEEKELEAFKEELEFNSSLKKDISLYKEAEQAYAETDILDLRAKLQKLAGTETSTSIGADEIERYLNQELSDEELSVFETEMENNPDLISEINLIRDINMASAEKDVMDLRAQLHAVKKEILEENQKERSFSAKITGKKTVAASVAASLALIVGIDAAIDKGNAPKNPGELYSQYFTPYAGTGVSRTSGTQLDNEISKALLKFNEKNYEESLNLFKTVLARDKENPVCNFYSGMAYQETGRYDEAIASYKNVIVAGNNLFIDQAEWYTGLCYLQHGERNNAVKLFRKIASGKSYYKQEASAILKKLKNMK